MMLMILGVFGFLAMGASSCDEQTEPDPQRKQSEQIERQAKTLKPYTPHNNVEFNNFNDAQKLYDDPNTILWCTAAWSNPSMPAVTFPVRGKLTSSSVSYRRQQEMVDHGNYSWSVLDAKSSDGMYHGSPPPYRYGFTPGGVYNDVFNMETFCTTALTKFTRQSTKIVTSLDGEAQRATSDAEAALKRGDEKEAQRILDTLDESGE